MKWNEHGSLKGLHAPLSASQSAWVNYDEPRLRQYMNNLKAKEKGTKDHEFANYAIENRYKMSNHKKSMNQFVNDSIGFRMTSEQTLFYSENCFGTADAISFEETDEGKVLKIFDLKTGSSRVTFRQLYVYTALFCLEYNHDPFDLIIELRIYQNNEIMVQVPEPLEVRNIIDTIVKFDKIIIGMK